MGKIPSSGRIGDFVDHRNGTVTDIRTGLMWMRCAQGQTWNGKTCVGKVQGYAWDEAMALRHDFAGYDDWRLPDIDELKSIIDKTRGRPAIDTAAFPNAPGLAFWSASVYDGNSDSAWVALFSNGNGYSFRKTGSLQVRLVRGEQALGTLNGGATSQATGFPVKEAPAVIQVETHKDAVTNIIDSPIRAGSSGNFVARSDGTATDTRTGLMWMRCALGQTWDGTTCVGKVQGYTWDEAMALRHSFSGHDDWRLPDIDELKSIIDKTRGRPAIDTAAFPNAPSLFSWSASVYAGDSNAAWGVDFLYGGGSSNYKSGNGLVRLVRGGKALGTLNGEAISQAIGFPVKETPVAIQVEAHKDASTSIIDSSICEEASGNFIAHSDGTVTDTRTGLMWMRCALGQTWDGTTCVGKVQGYTWDEAMALRHSFSGHDDWRLPDIDELKSIIDKTRDRPAIDTAVFPNTPGRVFWSISTYVGDSDYAWSVSFYSGNDDYHYKVDCYYVRLVRGGQASVTLNCDAIDKANSSPVEEAPVAIQAETRRDASINVIDSPLREKAPDNFVVHADGTVTDTRTGLIWMRCALGQTWDGTTCVGKVQGCTWDEAMALRHSFVGHDDWRLPDIDELKSIIDKTRGRPAIDTAVFPNATSSYFWSGSPSDFCSGHAWYVYFGNGLVDDDDHSNDYGVRFVRGGQVETHEDASTNIIDSSIREEVSGNFVIRRDGTVTDSLTGLMWMRCAVGQAWDGTTCVGEAQKHTWDEAMALRHGFAGHDDWRLPSIDELKSIVDKTRVRPAIDTAVFPNASDQGFWSASAYAGNSAYAWYVYFSNGGDGGNYKANEYYVRLVRGGQPLGALNGDAISKASSSPAKEAPEAIQSETHQDASINAVDLSGKTPGDFANNGEAQTTESISEITTVIDRLKLLEEKLSGSLARVERMGDGQASAKSIVHAAIAFIRQQPELFPAEIAELRGFLWAVDATLASTSAVTNQPALAEPESLKQVVAWLMTQEIVALSDLRIRLLPLDLLPGAVIDDLNERALDLTGDPAIEDDGDCIIIVREVLVQVVSEWQGR